MTGDLDGPRVSGSEKVRQSEEVAHTCEFDLRESTAYGNAFDDRFLLVGCRSSRRGQSRRPVSASGSQEGLADLYLLLKDNLEP